MAWPALPFWPRGGRALAVTRAAPHLRGAVNLQGIMRIVVLALAPCVLMALYNSGHQANTALAGLGLDAVPGWRGALLDALGVGHDPAAVLPSVALGTLFFLPVFAVALVTGDLWERIFATWRRRPRGEGLGVTALIFALILPPAAPLWQVALGMSFGVVVGKEIFGGTGRNFLNPAVTGLAFLYLAYPNAMAGDPLWIGLGGYGGATIFGQVAALGMDAVGQAGITWWQAFLGRIPGPFGETSTLACLLGAAVLIATGAASWRIMAGALLGLIGTAVLFNLAGGDGSPIFAMPWSWHLVLGGFAFGAVFLATDPVSAAATDTGRWLYGLLFGFMVVLIRVANPVHPDGVMFAVLFANVFAPLIDYGVVWANIRRRARRDD